MTGNATALTRETARAKENREYVRHLLKVRQPQFAAAVESAIQQLLRDHEAVCACQTGVPDDSAQPVTTAGTRPIWRWRT
jgi:hypothetical protein